MVDKKYISWKISGWKIIKLLCNVYVMYINIIRDYLKLSVDLWKMKKVKIIILCKNLMSDMECIILWYKGILNEFLCEEWF